MTAPPISRDHSLEPNLAENASVKLIGLGGVGGIVARYGAMFLASLGRAVRLVLIDGDSFEPSNASRMFFGDCGNKAAVTRAELLPRFAESALALIAIEEFVTADNLPRLLHGGDIIIHLFRPDVRGLYNLEKMWGMELPEPERALSVG